MLPDYSILNSSICLNASLKIKSSCVIDAFSQAIESFWSVGANLESIKFAKKAIHLINKHIDNFHINHKDEKLSDILLGAHFRESNQYLKNYCSTCTFLLHYFIFWNPSMVML